VNKRGAMVSENPIMNALLNIVSSFGRRRSRSCRVMAIVSPLLFFIGGVSMRCATAAPLESPNSSTAPKLTQEFDLVPNLLSAAKGQSEGDPLKAISGRMTAVHHDLSQLETDEPVQTKERQVVRSLDEMIAALQRHCSGLGRGNIPGTGRKDSVIAKGEAKIGDLHGVDPNARQWAQLPPKLRNEILQSKTDGFPPGYEALLQSYYQQLAEEKSLDDKAANSPAAADSKPTVSKPGSP